MSKTSKILANKHKRHLDLNALQSGRYGVIARIDAEGTGYPSRFATFIQLLRQAYNDLRRAQPNFSHGDVIVDFPKLISLKLVVPATPQGALALISPETEGFFSSQEEASHLDHCALEDSALAEAEHLATTAACISISAVDVGNEIASRAEMIGLPLERLTEQLAASPDEVVSRKICARARGAEQQIQYSQGERTIGGGRIISADTRSQDSFQLTQCMISPANYGRSLVLEGNSNDSEWHRLTDDFPGIRLVRGMEGSGTMEILQYAAFTKHAVDVEICVSERIETKRRWLEPIRVLNLKEIIAQARERLDLLEETYA